MRGSKDQRRRDDDTWRMATAEQSELQPARPKSITRAATAPNDNGDLRTLTSTTTFLIRRDDVAARVWSGTWDVARLGDRLFPFVTKRDLCRFSTVMPCLKAGVGASGLEGRSLSGTTARRAR